MSLLLLLIIGTPMAHCEDLDWGQVTGDLDGIDASSITPITDSRFLLIDNIFSPGTTVFQVRENSNAQALIDDAITKMFASSHRKTLCSLGGTSPETVRSSFGVSEANARSISEKCLREDSSLVLSKQQNKMSKSWHIALSETPAPFQSWTGTFNNSIIFVDKAVSRKEFYARIYHEIYISYDSFLFLGEKNADELLRDFNIKTRNTQSLSKMMDLLSYPLVRMTFASLRGIKFEAQVVSETFGTEALSHLESFPALELLNRRENSKAALIVANSLLPLQSYILPFQMLIETFERRISLFSSQYLSVQELQNTIATFEACDNDFSVSGERYSLLEILSEPALGPHGQFFTSGPRPRVGGGWGQKSTIDINDRQLPVQWTPVQWIPVQIIPQIEKPLLPTPSKKIPDLNGKLEVSP